VSWARTTTEARITSTGHGLKIGDIINVITTSDAAAIILGQKTLIQNVASASPPNPANVICFTCLNAGATSGTLTFVPMTGRVAIQMNEATVDTVDVYEIEAGSTAFTSAGGLYMAVVGDRIKFECPYMLLGHESFPIAEAVMAGGTIANYDIFYTFDRLGTGYVDSGVIEMNVELGTATYTRLDGGSFITDGFVAGQTVYMSGFDDASNNGQFLVDSVANDTLVVDDPNGNMADETSCLTGRIELSNSLYYTRVTGGGSNGSTNVTMADTKGVRVGDYVWGTNIAPNAKVSSITNGTTIVVNIANIGVVSGTLRFNQLPNEAVVGSSGVRIKVRIVTITANATAITSLYFFTGSTETTRAYQYSLDPVPLTITVKDINTGLPIENARVFLETVSGGVDIFNNLTDVNGQVKNLEYAYTVNQAVTGRARKASSATYYKTSPIVGTITKDGLSLTVFLIPDV